MKVGRFATGAKYSVVGLLFLVSGWPSRALAQGHDTHTLSAPQHEQTQEQRKQANALVQVVREATERFRDVRVAEAEGYTLQFGCVSGSDLGAMGMHFVNGSLVGDGEVDPLDLVEAPRFAQNMWLHALGSRVG